MAQTMERKVDSHATARHVRKPPPGGNEGRTGGEIFVECLEALGVDTLFGLCGHTVIGFMDALFGSKINLINFRHEQFAAHAADGYFRVTHKPGVLMTHLGPGLTNAVTGVANAALDSSAHGGDRRRHPDPAFRTGRAPGGQGARRRHAVRDLQAVRQAHLARAERRGDPRHRRPRLQRRHLGPPRAGADRRADGHLLAPLRASRSPTCRSARSPAAGCAATARRLRKAAELLIAAKAPGDLRRRRRHPVRGLGGADRAGRASGRCRWPPR